MDDRRLAGLEGYYGQVNAPSDLRSDAGRRSIPRSSPWVPHPDVTKNDTPTEALWANVVAFDEAIQAELLRFKAGDAVSSPRRSQDYHI
jgi:hypothetical protein